METGNGKWKWKLETEMEMRQSLARGIAQDTAYRVEMVLHVCGDGRRHCISSMKQKKSHQIIDELKWKFALFLSVIEEDVPLWCICTILTDYSD